VRGAPNVARIYDYLPGGHQKVLAALTAYDDYGLAGAALPVFRPVTSSPGVTMTIGLVSYACLFRSSDIQLRLCLGAAGGRQPRTASTIRTAATASRTL
jgi:hypothetical protein